MGVGLADDFNNIVYDNCNPDDELFGEKLASIVGYAYSYLNIQTNIRGSGEETYNSFCSQIGKYINSSEPYMTIVEGIRYEPHEIATTFRGRIWL